MALWQKKTQKEISKRIFDALKETVNFYEQAVLGMPASHLDTKVFSHDASFVDDAPFITTLLHNPNNIGCHTLGKSLSFFHGTQEIEKELIEICATEIFHGQPASQDGYVTSGGTEANLQAMWIYRNYFMYENGAVNDEIAILCSSDTHYSVNKGSNIFSLDLYTVPVDDASRLMTEAAITNVVEKAIADGKKHFIVIANMMTTMFGSVDDIDLLINVLDKLKCDYMIHVDGAFGGFFYPFSASDATRFDFRNPKITSVALDAHKMVQAPYGTGIFLIRKGFMKYANTKEATYVEGEDFTLIGSRSGANAVAVWMILMKNGPFGWKEKIYILLKRTEWLCEQLEECGLDFYRQDNANIVTIRASSLENDIAEKFGLVADNHEDPTWYKIVVMDHVSIEDLLPMLDMIRGRQHDSNGQFNDKDGLIKKEIRDQKAEQQ